MHILGKGYKHKDRDFKSLSTKVGAQDFAHQRILMKNVLIMNISVPNVRQVFKNKKSECKYHEMWVNVVVN